MPIAAIQSRRRKSEVLAPALTPHLSWRQRPAPELLPTGIPNLELPRGAIADLYGAGRTTFLVSALAEATARQETCAVVDTHNIFDPASAAAAGADLDRILWVRCNARPDKALHAADLIIQAGGFGLVALDLGDVPPSVTRRIPLTSWYRFRRAVEDTPTVMLVLEREPTAKAAAALLLELRRDAVQWSGAPGCSRLLDAVHLAAIPRKAPGRITVAFDARA
jgi:hypothetical protein